MIKKSTNIFLLLNCLIIPFFCCTFVINKNKRLHYSEFDFKCHPSLTGDTLFTLLKWKCDARDTSQVHRFYLSKDSIPEQDIVVLGFTECTYLYEDKPTVHKYIRKLKPKYTITWTDSGSNILIPHNPFMDRWELKYALPNKIIEQDGKKHIEIQVPYTKQRMYTDNIKVTLSLIHSKGQHLKVYNDIIGEIKSCELLSPERIAFDTLRRRSIVSYTRDQHLMTHILVLHATYKDTLSSQEYYNPITPDNRCGFDILEPGFMEVFVLDVNRKRVRELFRDTISEGHMIVNFDGMDDNGRDVPNGVYFCQIWLNGKQQETTGRIVIMR